MRPGFDAVAISKVVTLVLQHGFSPCDDYANMALPLESHMTCPFVFGAI
jgi:hypothetical protein